MAVKRSGKKRKSTKKTKSRGNTNITLRLLLVAVCAVVVYFVVKDTAVIRDVKKTIAELTSGILQKEKVKHGVAWEASLFFSDSESDMLIAEYRTIQSFDDPVTKAEAVLNALIDGPESQGIRTIPERTEVLEVSIDKNGTVSADFSKPLIDDHPGGTSSELLTVYSIVNTVVANIESAAAVQILVDGLPIKTLTGHLDCRKAFSMKKDIIK